MKIYVRKPGGSIAPLIVESKERICSIKRKLKEQEGIPSDLHLGLIYDGQLVDDGHTVAHYNIIKRSTLRLFLSHDSLVETWELRVKTRSEKRFSLEVTNMDTIDDVKAKIQENEGVPPHKQLLFNASKWLEDGNRTLADYHVLSFHTLDLVIQVQQGSGWPNVTSQGNPLPPIRTSAQAPQSMSPTPQQTKRACLAIQTSLSGNSRAIYDRSDGEDDELEDLTRTVSSRMSDVSVENKNVEKELTVARNKEKELEATISGLKAENKKTKQELTVARNKEKEVEATIAGLKAENNRTKEELTVFGKKEKELEVSISELMHKNKVFSAQCDTYESQVLALEVENKKINEELMNADKKYYAGARAAGYAEGLKEGKTKCLKSIGFLRHLIDASMQYFNHGFDSCQKQAEQQGFAGKLNKDSALKEAPNLKGWALPE